MENAMARPRCARRPAQNRRRRKAPGAEGAIGRLIVKQAVVCALLLLIIWIIKGIDLSAAKYVTNKVKYIISYNVEPKSIFAYMEKLAMELRDSISPPKSSAPSASDAKAADASGLPETSSSTPTSSNALTSSSTQTSYNAPTSNNAQTSGMAEASDAARASDDIIPLIAAAGDAVPLSGMDIQEGQIAAGSSGKAVAAASTGNGVRNTEDDQASNGVEKLTGDYENNAIKAAGDKNEESGQVDMLQPVEGTIVSGQGDKAEDTSSSGKIRQGIDIAVRGGIAIKAALDGKVTETGSSPSYGRYVRIIHAGGLQTIYANCTDILAKKGDIVKRGDTIAEIGGNNMPTEVYLHFEVWENGKSIDPLKYLNTKKQ